MKLHDYAGFIHLHSAFSYDGHSSIEKIISAANKNGIDFLMLTDHDHLRAKKEGWEGWQGKTLIIVGEEIAPRFNHYIAFNLTDPVLVHDDPEGSKPQRYIDAVNNQGGFGFIAHPDHEGTVMFHVKHYCWNDWTIGGYSGIGVWDFMTDWQRSLRGYLTGLLCIIWPAYFLRGPSKITLERWDALNQKRKTIGIGELDNHASIKKIGCVRFVAFPFERAFRFVSTHVIIEQPFSGHREQDINSVFKALQYGRCYFALEYFCNAHGFEFFIKRGTEIFHMGDCLNLSIPSELKVLLPKHALIRIIRNGREVKKTISDDLSIRIEQPGVYRAEAYLKSAFKYRPWIFSNPIYVI